MSTFRRRVADIEERSAVRNYAEMRREFEGRSQDKLQFFALYGYFPQPAGRASGATGVHRSWHSDSHHCGEGRLTRPDRCRSGRPRLFDTGEKTSSMAAFASLTQTVTPKLECIPGPPHYTAGGEPT
jgi:hypothetical protein